MQSYFKKVEDSIFSGTPTAEEIRNKQREEADSSLTAKIFGKKAARWLDGVEDSLEELKKEQPSKTKSKDDATKPQDPPKKTETEKNKSEEKKPEKPSSTSAQVNKTLKAKPAATPPAATITTTEKSEPPGKFKEWFMPKTYKQELKKYHQDRRERRQEITDTIKAKQDIKKIQASGFKF